MPADTKPEDLSTAKYWTDEITASEKAFEKFHTSGKKVLERFLDKSDSSSLFTQRQSLNLFHSNIITLRSILYGQTPKVDVSRRYDDANDDVGRVGAEILERCLNNDIQFTDDTFSEAIRSGLDDFLLPGLGQAKVRYEPIIKADEMGVEYVDTETAPVDYIHWKDFLWGAGARTWSEVPWVAFRTYVTKDEATAKWGEDIAKRLSYSTKKDDDRRTYNSVVTPETQWAQIWEVWCKKSKHVYWWSKGLDELCGKMADPLKLMQFWPCPQPMLANITTDCLIPKAEYLFAQDLYLQIDTLQTRIMLLAKAIKVVGVYDKNSIGVQRMIGEASENELIPVDNWAAFAEKGGIKGQVDWLPIEQIANVMQQLIGVRDQTIQLLYQSTGMSDILRGATDPRETMGAQTLKAKFASTRIQAMQDMFAKFASDIQKIKAEVMSKHYQPKTLIQQSNIMMTPDAQIAEQAVMLIKQPGAIIWRVQIRPESVAMVDYAQLKEERTEYIMAVSQFMQSAAPLVGLDKSVTPTLLQLLQWGLSGFKGSQQIEGVLDRAISDATAKLSQPEQPPPPDPKVEAMKMKAQIDQQQAQMDAQQQQQKFQMEMMQSQQKFQMEQEQANRKFQMEMTQMLMEARTKKQIAVQDAQANIVQRGIEAEIDIERRDHESELAEEAAERASGEET